VVGHVLALTPSMNCINVPAAFSGEISDDCQRFNEEGLNKTADGKTIK